VVKLDGIYVLRTSVADGDPDSPEVVSCDKALAQVERVTPGRYWACPVSCLFG
jgi:hypothetical protein